MRAQSRFSAILCTLSALACSRPVVGPAAPLPERTTAAFAKAARLHASEFAGLPAPEAAGLWVVEDTAGNLIASGVIPVFPTTISSENYESVVPGAAGLAAREFGFARTHPTRALRALPVAYVTVLGRS